MTRCHFRYKRQSKRADKQFCYRQEEVGYNQYPRPCFFQTGCTHGFCTHRAEFGARRITANHRVNHQEQVCSCRYGHTNGNLTRGGDGLSAFGHCAKYQHDDRRKDNHEARVQCLPNLRCNRVRTNEVASKYRKRLTILMERKPEEYSNTQYCEQSIHTLLDFFCHCLLLFCRIFSSCRFLFLTRLRIHLLRADKYNQRNEHGSNRSDKRVVNTLVKYRDIILAECQLVSHYIAFRDAVRKNLGELGQSISIGCAIQHFMANLRHVGVVNHCVLTKPPLTKKRCYEGSNQTAYIDEHVENLKTDIAFVFCCFQRFRTLLLCFCFCLVIHLTYNCLQVALKQTITKCNHKQRYTGEDKDCPPFSVAIHLAKQGDRQRDIAN